MNLARQLVLKLIGIAFHVGTQNVKNQKRLGAASPLVKNFSTWRTGTTVLPWPFWIWLEAFQGINARILMRLQSWLTPRWTVTFQRAAASISLHVYYVASAFTLATQIHSRRKLIVYADAQEIVDGKYFYYYTNDGFYGSFLGKAVVNHKFTPFLLESRPGPDFNSFIWDPTLDSLDCVVANVLLPPAWWKLGIGLSLRIWVITA